MRSDMLTFNLWKIKNTPLWFFRKQVGVMVFGFRLDRCGKLTSYPSSRPRVSFIWPTLFSFCGFALYCTHPAFITLSDILSDGLTPPQINCVLLCDLCTKVCVVCTGFSIILPFFTISVLLAMFQVRSIALDWSTHFWTFSLILGQSWVDASSKWVTQASKHASAIVVGTKFPWPHLSGY